MNFKNLEKFQTFLEKNLNTSHVEINICLEDFKKQIGASGGTDYELSSYETKSGKPEIISFERIDRYFLDDEEVDPGENDFDYAETTIIF